jgi:trigger factor
MKFIAKKLDKANAEVSATISPEQIALSVETLAKKASKTTNIQGFRKGKVPVSIIKQRYGQKMEEDAINEVLKDIFTEALKDLKIKNEDLIGEPAAVKFDKKNDGSVEVKLKISVKPLVDLGDYKSLLPEVKTKKVTIKEIDQRIAKMASNDTPLIKIKRKRKVKNGDFTLIDFEGFKDGVAFEGGKAQNHSLEIGSNSFIPGFEDQIIGMAYDEEKEINVTFPAEYQSKDLASADVIFKVKLHEIQEKSIPIIDDAFAQKILKDTKDATIDTLKSKIKEQIKSEKINRYYNEELKPVYLNILIDKIDFAVPQSILDQEVNQTLNTQIQAMSKDEVAQLQQDSKQIDKMRKDAEPEAKRSVKATFIIDALAKSEKVEIVDEEVSKAIYYEAMMQGKDGIGALKNYEEMGYLPAIKMSMLEQKVINKLLDEKSGK